ncbi:MAG: GNAT family N-acetyltransferase [Armatimonadota bacterium]
METHLTDVTLKSGEPMRIVRIDAPDPVWKDRILPFLQHKGDPWLWQMEVALGEGLGECAQHYYLGVLEGGEVVGNIMTTESMQPPIGILGHVFTPPEHRRKGICSRLMEALTEDFRARDGRAMFLHTGYDSPPYHIYAAWGFKGYRRTGAMAWVLEEGFWRKQFAPRPVHVRETDWADWAPLEALSWVDTGWHLRSVFLGIYGFGGFEGHYIRVQEALRGGRLMDFRVLAAEDGAVAGYALLGRLRSFPGEPLVLDMFVHPDFVKHATELAQAIEIPPGERTLAFADSASVGKLEALAAAGLAQEASLRGLLTDERGNLLDLLILSRGS